jgi:hypothetical protein
MYSSGSDILCKLYDKMFVHLSGSLKVTELKTYFTSESKETLYQCMLQFYGLRKHHITITATTSPPPPPRQVCITGKQNVPFNINLKDAYITAISKPMLLLYKFSFCNCLCYLNVHAVICT